MMLRYVTWMQRGIKTASDAYARIMASVGSLERVVELHDRGVFRDAAQSLGRELVPVRGTRRGGAAVLLVCLPERARVRAWLAEPGALTGGADVLCVPWPRRAAGRAGR